MLYHAGPSSLGFFAECLKIITDSTLEIQSYKIQVQIKPKLHQLWRIALWLGKFHLSVFLNIVWVFWLERVVRPLVIAFEQQSLFFCYCHFENKSPLPAICSQNLRQTAGNLKVNEQSKYKSVPFLLISLGLERKPEIWNYWSFEPAI